MASNNKRSTRAVNILYGLIVIIAIIMILPNVVWVYFKFYPEKGPESHVASYVGTMVDEEGKERNFIELEYWENKNNDGERVLEISFNAYSDPKCTSNVMLRKGAQFTFDISKPNIYSAQRSYYDRAGLASWRSIDKVDNKMPMYVTIDKKVYSVTMDGTYIHTWKSVSAKAVAETVIFCGWNKIVRSLLGETNVWAKDSYYQTNQETRTYTMDDFYNELFNAVIYNNIGYGSNILSLVDLARFFTIKENNGQFTDIEENQEYAKEYFSIKVTKHREGFIRASESAFEMYHGDSEFTLIETDNLLNDFTSIDDIVTLNYQDFDYKLCQEYGGFIAYIKDDIRTTLLAGKVNEIAINLDLSNAFFDSADMPVIGIMYDFIPVSNIVITFNQTTFPMFYEFYSMSIGRKYLPTDDNYKVYNKANEGCGISSFDEVAL